LAWLGGNEEMLKKIMGKIEAVSNKTLGIKVGEQWYNTKEKEKFKQVVQQLNKDEIVELVVNENNDYIQVKKVSDTVDKKSSDKNINLSVCLKAVIEFYKGKDVSIEQIAVDTKKLYDYVFEGKGVKSEEMQVL